MVLRLYIFNPLLQIPLQKSSTIKSTWGHSSTNSFTKYMFSIFQRQWQQNRGNRRFIFKTNKGVLNNETLLNIIQQSPTFKKPLFKRNLNIVEQRVQRKKDTFEIVQYYTLLYQSELLKGSKLHFISFWPKFGIYGALINTSYPFHRKLTTKSNLVYSIASALIWLHLNFVNIKFTKHWSTKKICFKSSCHVS